MNPLAFGGETDELLRQRRTQTSSDDLPAFCRDWCPPLLLDILPHVDVWPDAAIKNPVGAQVRELSDVQYSLIYDLPLPVIIRRRRIALIVLAENGLSSQRTRHWPVRSDIERACPQAIFVSRQCAVTMAFVELLDRRRRLRLNLQALNRDIVSRYLDSLVQVMRQRGELCDSASEYVLHLAPSPYVLRLVSDRCLDCFVPAYFAEHLRLARQIDGAGLRLDAEFKMAKRIRCHGETHGVLVKRVKLQNPFKCTLACRGVRGLYLAPLSPFTTGETGDAYVQFLVPLLQERRATCENDVAQGLPDFISFDNGPACCLYALAAVGEVWPQAVYGQDQPPCKTAAASRLHSSLRRDSVSIVSDPPHRRWHWQKALPCEHPDYALFDKCLAFALARISASLPLVSRQHMKTEPHVRGYDEDETILRQLAVLVDTQPMLSCVRKAALTESLTFPRCERAWLLPRCLRVLPAKQGLVFVDGGA